MSSLKRKARELGEQGLSAALGEVAARTVAVAVGRYDAQATVDDQLDQLTTLVIIIHSAVEVAEGVHIRSRWLRRWLWRLRDAAADGDDVLRSFQRRPCAAEEEAEASNTAAVSTLWNAARRVLIWSAKLFAGDQGTERLSRTVARLEKFATGIGDFLSLIELEMRVSLPEPPPLPSLCSAGTYLLGGISCEDYTAMTRAIVLVVVRRNIRQAIDVFFRATPRPAVVSYIQPPRDVLKLLHDRVWDAIDKASEKPEVQGRRWLAEWRRQLQALTEKIDLVLQPAAPVETCGVLETGDANLRRTVESMKTAVAHLRDFAAVLRIYGYIVSYEQQVDRPTRYKM